MNYSSYFSSLFINLHLIGNLCIASLNASLAISSLTPPTSNITVPLFTTATHESGAPLPEPILTSNGFLVLAKCGNTLIQTFPNLFMYLVIAILAASICLFVIQQPSIACKPNSPNAM
jgi:hypothetical protein